MFSGSFVFMTIEGSLHSTRNHMVALMRNQTAERLWTLTCCECNPLEEEPWKAGANETLLAFQRFVVEAVQVRGYEGEDFGGNRWSFSGSFLYSLTVITTIGEEKNQVIKRGIKSFNKTVNTAIY